MSKVILIVEDDGLIAMINKKIVERLGFTVCHTTATGAGAIEAFKVHNPDIILMDIMLEDNISGIDAMLEIRKLSSNPVIFISANSDKLNFDKATSIANSSFISKPVVQQILKEKLESL
ncbi:MAG: hypothetical protein RLZZ175_3293 [Bacteroidota bacterium]|jgi:CheY-like chemotaxis protein